MVKISSDTLRLAVILGVVVPGVGHIYLGQIKRGIKIVLLIILSGTLSAAIFSYLTTILNRFAIGGIDFLFSLIAPAVSLIPIIVWVWQIRDLRRIIKKLTGYSVEELEPPTLEVGTVNLNNGTVCPSCGKGVNNESRICANCGLKL
jgi:TM2 domain-containing membrane protein YozV